MGNIIDRYAVFGNPIAHSKSPQIHAQFAKQTKQALIYEKCLIELDDFANSVHHFFLKGGKGLNITVPFKEAAWRCAKQRSLSAELAGAVNTLMLKDNILYGDNTDGIGLVTDLGKNMKIDLSAKNILLIGAGGAAKGVIYPLLQHHSRLHISNRTLSKANDLAAKFKKYGEIEAITMDKLGKRSYDIIINATSAGLAGEVPNIPGVIVTAKTICYDMLYANHETAFMQWSRQQGAKLAVDGLGMLVEQAAAAFKLWRLVTPNTTQVLRNEEWRK